MRYRIDYQVPRWIRCSIDIAFTRVRLGVFIDGCWWHGGPKHFAPPVQNQDWWTEKISRNQARDLDVTVHLDRLGWTVLRFWEHELREATEHVASVVQRTHADLLIQL